MQEISKWWTQNPTEKTWLVVGKGPSFENRGRFNLDEFSVLALNHSIEHLERADIVSAIDLHPVIHCGEAIDKKAKFLLMPHFPHEHPNIKIHRPEKPIEAFFDEIPLLKKLAGEGRLLVYNLNLATGDQKGDGPIFQGGKFSAEVIISMLAQLGEKKIRTLGVDGGTQYAREFAAISKQTKFANTQTSFDVQNQGIGRAILQHKLDLLPLGEDGPIRVFVGTDISQMLGAKVLEHSLQTHTPMTAVFDTMQNVNPPQPKDKANQARTQFSFRRFAIPQLAGFKGRGVYVDADMQVFHDFRELWNTPFDGATVLYAPSSSPSRPSQFSVVLLDCERLKWDVDEIMRGMDEGKYAYDGLMKEMCIVPKEQVQARLSPDWNSLEEYHQGRTRLIHYTDMPSQPWVYARNPNGDLWVTELQEAIYDEFVSWDEVEKAVKDGFARPSLLKQLKISRRVWPQFNKTVARVLDGGFRPHAALAKRLAQGN